MNTEGITAARIRGMPDRARQYCRANMGGSNEVYPINDESPGRHEVSGKTGRAGKLIFERRSAVYSRGMEWAALWRLTFAERS